MELKKVLEALIERKEKDSLLSNNQEVDKDIKVLKEIIPVSILGVTLGFVIYIIIRFP